MLNVSKSTMCQASLLRNRCRTDAKAHEVAEKVKESLFNEAGKVSWEHKYDQGSKATGDLWKAWLVASNSISHHVSFQAHVRVCVFIPWLPLSVHSVFIKHLLCAQIPSQGTGVTKTSKLPALKF